MDFQKTKLKNIKRLLLLLWAVLGIVFLTNQQISPHVSYSFPASTVTVFTYPVFFTETPANAVLTISPTAQAIKDKDEFIPPQKDFFLYIPKINLQAPVFPNVSGTDKNAYLKVLENGVAHYAGTSLPGEQGRVFIFGHSSYYANLPGNYKKIFALLNNLNIEDEIRVYFKEKEYVYKVKDKKIVSPDDLSVLKPTETKTLSLQTCWPPGTVQKRLVVNSEQVF